LHNLPSSQPRKRTSIVTGLCTPMGEKMLFS
jgi:hypothetical protein